MKLDVRMKHYEHSVGSRLTLRCPAIIRVDGRAFHSFTRGFEKPFDLILHRCMVEVAKSLCRDVSTAVFAYGQSDEVSVLLVDYVNFDTQQWFDGKAQKIASVAASRATLAFNREIARLCNKSDSYEIVLGDKQHQAMFDARVFSVPERDVINYFIWRQQDAVRNSVQSLGQAHFSHRELQGQSGDNIIDILSMQGISWNEQSPTFKYGWAVAKVQGVKETPVGDIDTKIWKEIKCPEISEHRVFVGQWMPDESAEYLTVTRPQTRDGLDKIPEISEERS